MRVVLNTPRLWSRARYSDRMSYVRTCLKRRKSVGLSIDLYLINDHGQDMKRESLFLAAVVPHSARWKHLHLSFYDSVLRLKSRKTILSNLRLSSLHSLSLVSSRPLILQDDIEYCYQTWEMPNLRSLEVDMIPKPLDAPKLSSMRLSWNFDIDIEGDAATSESLRSFLTAFPELGELRVEFQRNGAQGYQQGLLIDMPNLKTCELGHSVAIPETSSRS